MGLGSGGLCGCQSEAGWPQQEPGVGRAPPHPQAERLQDGRRTQGCPEPRRAHSAHTLPGPLRGSSCFCSIFRLFFRRTDININHVHMGTNILKIKVNEYISFSRWNRPNKIIKQIL